MERCCHFVDDLCRHEDLSVIFPSSVSLIPPGISLATGNKPMLGGGGGGGKDSRRLVCDLNI